VGAASVRGRCQAPGPRSSERRTRAEFDRQDEAGVQAALKRCRGLAEQIESELCNKRLDFDSVLSLANFQVALERAAGVLKQR
jgi:hypothetical protein